MRKVLQTSLVIAALTMCAFADSTPSASSQPFAISQNGDVEFPGIVKFQASSGILTFADPYIDTSALSKVIALLAGTQFNLGTEVAPPSTPATYNIYGPVVTGFSDGTIFRTSRILTSASSNFTPDFVGARISVVGAGPLITIGVQIISTDLNTTITRVIDARNVELGHEAEQTVQFANGYYYQDSKPTFGGIKGVTDQGAIKVIMMLLGKAYSSTAVQ